MDVDTYLDVRNRIHAATPMPREAVLDQRRQPGNLDLIAELDEVPVGVATVSKYGGSPDGDLAFVSIRVLREERRKGIGTALQRRASGHARKLGKARFYTVARADDVDSLGYYALRGFQEIGRMQDVRLDLASAVPGADVPAGIELVSLTTPELRRGAYRVALEALADVPTGAPLERGTFEQWSERTFGALVLPELSFVAVDGGEVVGYAVLGRHGDDTAQHWMTGVARSARGRGIATALKQAQIARAKAAGWRYLITQNDLANDPMRRVNEKLGYERRFEWVHLTGPLLA